MGFRQHFGFSSSMSRLLTSAFEDFVFYQKKILQLRGPGM
jgi:hypothetical protein